VDDPGGEISKAGISISSQSTISYSSVTVGAVYGFWLPGSTMTTVSYSSAQADGGSALYVNGASSNTFTVFFSSDSTGHSALLDAGARFNTITLSTFTNYSGSNNNGFYINGASSNTVTRSYIYTRGASSNANTLGLSAGSLSNTISLSTAVNSCSSGGHAILFNGASSNTVSQSFIYGVGGGDDVGMFLENGASGNTISWSTVTSSGYYALELSDASTNTITQSYGSSLIGAYLLAQSDYNTISLSTFTSTGGSFGGLYMTASSYNTITQSFLAGVPQGAEIANGNNNTLTRSFFSASGTGSAGVFLSGANGNTISQSTMTTASGGYYGLELSNSSSNTITQSYGSSLIGAYLLAQSDYNTISLSTFTGTSGTYGGLYMTASSANVVTQAFFTGGAAGVEIASGGDDNVISLSTMTGSTYGLFATGGSSNTIDDSYMQGNWGAYLTSTQTTIGGSVLVPTAVNYSGLVVGGGSVNFSVSSTTILAGPGGTGAGIYFFAGTSGLINLSSNTISSSYQYGIDLATQAPDAAIWITSNTITPTVTNANDTYGLYFAGLPSGATVQNNAIVWRDAGSQSGHTAYGLYAHSVAGLNFDHNRINMPGLLTAGSFIGAYFTGAQQTSFKFNDINSTGTAFTNAYLVRLAASTVTIRDNVFLSSFSFTTTGSSASLTADAASGFGGADGSDYNDWYSSNSLNTFIWGAAAAQFSGGWFGQDADSIAADPSWHDVSSGVEDFHPQSKAGRYDPSTGGFVTDAAQSPTIDAGDPAEDYSLEPSP
ncbi:MAG: right-handed parallel beta-helix repeat-containing protein, partial [Elusimicrobia bacterium]|nr:right-handed parallel beta-helix repeat-containing protein [Elusimicrobiota bacterium]